MSQQMPHHPSASAMQPARLRTIYWIAAAGASLNIVRSLHNNTSTSTMLTDPYWVDFYLTNYQDGYRRRALVGSFCRLIFPHGIHILLINIFALFVLGAAFFLLLRALCPMVASNDSQRARLFLFALCGSTLTAVFYETFGDLLQLTLVLFTLSLLLTRLWLRGRQLSVLVALATVAICFLIHEASVFLLTPAVPFFLKRRPRMHDFALPLCVLSALVALSIHWSGQTPHPTYQAILFSHRVFPANAGATPSLLSELQAEYKVYFGSTSAVVYFLWRLTRIAALGFALPMALGLCLSRRAAERSIRALGVIVLVSLPLWCIAIDWGRFVAYALFLAVVAASLWQPAQNDVDKADDDSAAPDVLLRLVDRLQVQQHPGLLELGAVFVLLTGPEMFATHIEGVSMADAQSFYTLGAVAVVAHLNQRRHAERYEHISSGR